MSIAAAGLFGTAVPASAHRDGCHRWHSCPSDTGSYVCGDLGYFSECGNSSLPDAKPEPEAPSDDEPPAQPTLGVSKAGPDGAVTLKAKAERGSRIEVRDENDAVVAKATATGATQRLSFTGDDGEHTYTVVAVDAAGNISEASDGFTLTVDSEKPELDGLAVDPVDPSTGITRIRFITEAKARYTIAVQGRKDRKERLSGTAGKDGKVTAELALPNGTHRITCLVRDDVGNESHTMGTAKLSLKTVKPGVRLSGTPDDGRARFKVSGPPKSAGTLKVGGAEYPVALGTQGRADVTAELKDGEYRAQLKIRDPFGRRGSALSTAFTVDDTPPPLSVFYDAERARYGDPVVTVRGEAGTQVILDIAGKREKLTLTGARRTYRPRLAPGQYRLTATATDTFGNSTRREITLRVSDEWTTGETAGALMWALGVFVLLAVCGWLLWRRRRGVMLRMGRWRESGRTAVGELAARVRAVRAEAEARRRAERALYARQAYDTALAAWQHERTRLAELHDLAVNLRGEAVSAPDFRWGRPKSGERVLLVIPAALVKIRTRQGHQYTERAENGELAVTDHRLVFVGATRREWAYDKWLRHDHQAGAAETMIMVSNRQQASGVGYAHADAPRVRLVINLALAESRGERSKVVEHTQRALADHDRRRPETPALV